MIGSGLRILAMPLEQKQLWKLWRNIVIQKSSQWRKKRTGTKKSRENHSKIKATLTSYFDFRVSTMNNIWSTIPHYWKVFVENNQTDKICTMIIRHRTEPPLQPDLRSSIVFILGNSWRSRQKVLMKNVSERGKNANIRFFIDL